MIAVATVFIGMSGGIAKYMNLFPPFMLLVRCWIGYFSLLILNFIFDSIRPQLLLTNKNIIISGLLMCFHWIAFFYAVQYGSVAVAIVAVFTYPLQSIFFEAFLTRKPVDRKYVVLSIFVIIGVYLMSPDFSLKESQSIGLFLGLLSGTLLGIRNIMSKTLMNQYTPNTVHVNQVLVAGIILLPFVFTEPVDNVVKNIVPLLSLGILTTAVGHLLLMKCLEYFTASEVGLLNGSQPIAAIIVAYFLVEETPTTQVVIGGAIIMAAVLYAGYLIHSKTE